MKILIAFAHPSEIAEFNIHIGNLSHSEEYDYKHIHIVFVQTGYTVYETAFSMGNAMANNSYHLIIYAGLGNSLNDKMKTGEVLNVINDIPFSIGRKDDQGFENAYTLNWLDKNEKPHLRGGYINLTNSYFNVFLPFMKTAALTSPILEGDKELLKLKCGRFPIHIESSNGIAFHYACLSKGLPFYQLRAIAYNTIDLTRNAELAIENLNKALIKIIDLL